MPARGAVPRVRPEEPKPFHAYGAEPQFVASPLWLRSAGEAQPNTPMMEGADISVGATKVSPADHLVVIFSYSRIGSATHLLLMQITIRFWKIYII